MRIFVSLLVFTIFGFASVNAIASASCPAQEDFKTITQTVELNFYDKKLFGLSWEESKQEAMTSLDCHSEDKAIAETINQLLAQLKASHTGLYTPENLKYWALKSIFSGNISDFKIPFTGIGFSSDGKNSFVSFILEGSSAAKASVRRGDRLESINGEAFSELGFRAGQSSELVTYRNLGEKRIFSIEPTTASVQAHFLEATRLSEKIIIKNGKKFGYFHLWCGTHDLFLQAFENSLRNFKKQRVSGLIIDLRDGFGGANPDYLKLLTTDPFLKSIPKYFLINEGVTSGKEWISAIIKRDGIGKLLGSRTAGAFLAGAKYDLLDSRFVLYLAVQEFNPPDIGKIEGIGIEPDIPVAPCVKYCNGYDSQLARSIELLNTEK